MNPRRERAKAALGAAAERLASASLTPDTLPSPFADVLERERQAFLDATAIALFARGRGPRNAYEDAEKLWVERQRRVK